MLRRLPLIAGIVAAITVLLVLGPIALAAALLRSSPEAEGASLAAKLLIASLLLAITALTALGAWWLTRLILRRLGRPADRPPEP